MISRGAIFPEKRSYNKWVASETLEDYALRYTADSARRWSIGRVANTAIGATAFLACEAIGAVITLNFGFDNSLVAILLASGIMFLVGLPIAVYAAREGLDMDLLTRGAGFGYLGSTITSLIYASFTFLLFAIEASIMAVALVALTGMPIALGYIISSLVILPIAVYGMKAITRFQAFTQPIWIVLQLAPVVYVLTLDRAILAEWIGFSGWEAGGLDFVAIGLATSTLLSLLPQIGEQADYLRFLPQKREGSSSRWWAAVLMAGPGWTLIGAVKLLIGSCLAAYVLASGASSAGASDPTTMFLAIFRQISGGDIAALLITALFVIVCQMKINVTNAYAGSIAWSNFFARLTHAHPGRVVWLIFNVLLALLLMLAGVMQTIQAVLAFFAIFTTGWLGALAADLAICKPLGLSPRGIEFHRAYLYDINPAGVGAFALSVMASCVALTGLFGTVAQAFAPIIGLSVAFIASPALALATDARFYIARPQEEKQASENATCVICENTFQHRDMAACPFYAGQICSLCCTLETRCHDMCKTRSTLTDQVISLLSRILPEWGERFVRGQVGRFLMLWLVFCAVTGGMTAAIFYVFAPDDSGSSQQPFVAIFVAFATLSGIAAWLITLAHDSRRAAERENRLHLERLEEEVAAHEVTDAELQRARQAAESANRAKSRYLTSVSHEIRSPLNSIYGYAQLLERERPMSPQDAGRVIRRSSEHLINMVEGLLDISQVEGGVMRLSRDTIRLPVFIDQIANMFVPQAEVKNLTFIREFATDLPLYVHADRKRLRQILINLISNAVKFTEMGSITFAVSYRSEIATFRIADTGVGIEKADLERIFQPFDRGSNTQSRQQQGVGLGLAITQSLVQILGGELTMSSEPGQGTSFAVKLMLARTTGENALAHDTVMPAGYEGPRRRIVLVDDSEEQLNVLTHLLEPLGFEISAFASALPALEATEDMAFDCALLDIGLPDIHGIQLAHLLRTRHGADPTIIMISGNVPDIEQLRGPEAPYDACLAKPVELNVLLQVLGRSLDLRWMMQEEGEGRLRWEAALANAPESVNHLEAILRSSEIGHVRDVERELMLLEKADPANKKLTETLRIYLNAFDFESVSRIVKSELSDV